MWSRRRNYRNCAGVRYWKDDALTETPDAQAHSWIHDRAPDWLKQAACSGDDDMAPCSETTTFTGTDGDAPRASTDGRTDSTAQPVRIEGTTLLFYKTRGTAETLSNAHEASEVCMCVYGRRRRQREGYLIDLSKPKIRKTLPATRGLCNGRNKPQQSVPTHRGVRLGHSFRKESKAPAAMARTEGFLRLPWLRAFLRDL